MVKFKILPRSTRTGAIQKHPIHPTLRMPHPLILSFSFLIPVTHIFNILITIPENGFEPPLRRSKLRVLPARRLWIFDDTHLVPPVGFEPTFLASEASFLPVRRQGSNASSFSTRGSMRIVSSCYGVTIKLSAEDSAIEAPSFRIHPLSTGWLYLTTLSSIGGSSSV